MSAQADFLFELGSEELPPKALSKFMAALQTEVEKGLADAQLNYAKLSVFAAPRRLAVLVHGLALAQPDRTVERKGPALAAAYDANGNPTKAAEGFAKSCGVAFADLEKMETPQGAWLVFRKDEAGQPAEKLLPGIVSSALDKLPIPKRMRWGARKEQFVRPVHWLIMLLGEKVIPCEILGLKSGQTSFGHRVHCGKALTIVQPANYEAQLAEQGYVLANFATRKQKIQREVAAIAEQYNAKAAMDEDLLDEVTALVEWPVPLVGQFEEKFLAVPQEALISTMQGNQKYFPLLDQCGKLTNRFITIANI
ncbi:MAG TPA: glycine--tRNA ligase subunit beta, partial [Pseudomonadales bacterium]|nr:glycine--tRNA ligase subunit beta [Pseudomonadales bacterium]